MATRHRPPAPPIFQISIKLWQITRPGITIRQKLADSDNICLGTYEKGPQFLTTSLIPIFWTIMRINCRVKSSQLKLFVFLTIYFY